MTADDLRYKRRRPSGVIMTALSVASVGALALTIVALALPFMQPPDLSPQTLSVVENALSGSAIIVVLALLGGVPTGVLVGVGVAEGGGATARLARAASDVLAAVPPIVVGFVVYATVVLAVHGGSTAAGAVAIGCLVAPAVCRATLEQLAATPASLRDAAVALGGTRARVVAFVLVRSIAPDLVRAVSRTTARAVGAGAPLLFVTAAVAGSGDVADASRVAALPTAAFWLASAPGVDAGARANTVALVLVLVVAGLGVLGRRRRGPR